MNMFQSQGYLLVPGLIDTTAYAAFLLKLAELGKGKRDEKQVPGSIAFYREPLFERLLEHLLPAIESHTGLALYKTYSYARCYELGNELERHLDREACEITVSLALGHEGEIWPLWLEDRQGQTHAVMLRPGDALIFRGAELPHWREVNRHGPSTQAFLHYVDRDGPHAACRDDADHGPAY